MGQYSILRGASESRNQKTVEGDSGLVPWMVMHATGIVCKFRVGRDGRTAC